MLMIRRRDLLKGTVALAGGSVLPWAAGAGHASAGQNAQGAPGSSRIVARGRDDLALVNGKFVDGRGNITTALTIGNGRITSVGSEKEPDAGVPVVDLGGRTVVPGLFDAHVHYARAGVNPGYEARRIERAFSIPELQEAIAARAKTVPAGAFITCIGGWNHLQFAEARRPNSMLTPTHWE
jgi:predicted amidohydrolase YtcJ